MQSTMESIAGFLRWGGVQAKGVTEGFLKKIVEASGRLGESQPPLKNPILGGSFKYCLCSPLCGEDFQFD